MRLIDVDILMETLGITNSCEDCAWKGNAFCRRGLDFENACQAIRNASTIESECKTGKWVKHNYNLLICSNCGCPAPAITTGSLVNRHREQIPSSYCWNCGAKMSNEKTI